MGPKKVDINYNSPLNLGCNDISLYNMALSSSWMFFVLRTFTVFSFVEKGNEKENADWFKIYPFPVWYHQFFQVKKSRAR